MFNFLGWTSTPSNTPLEQAESPKPRGRQNKNSRNHSRKQQRAQGESQGFFQSIAGNLKEAQLFTFTKLKDWRGDDIDRQAQEYRDKFKVSVGQMIERRDQLEKKDQQVLFSTEKGKTVLKKTSHNHHHREMHTTQHRLQQGIVLGSGQLLFVTYGELEGEAESSLFLELCGSNGVRIPSSLNPMAIKLQKATQSVQVQMLLDQTKRFAAILVQDIANPFQGGHWQIYILDCFEYHELKDQEDAEQRFKRSIKPILNGRDSLEYFNYAEKVLLEFTYPEHTSLVPKLRIIIHHKVQKQVQPNLKLSDTMKKPALGNKCFEVLIAHLFGAKDAPKGILVPFVDYELKNDVPAVGIHAMSKTEVAVIYENGVVEFSNLLHMKQFECAPRNFQCAATFCTQGEHGTMLILQDVNQRTVGVMHTFKDTWVQMFVTENSFKYRFLQVSGKYAVCQHIKTKELTLIEIGSNNGFHLVTECPLKFLPMQSSTLPGVFFDSQVLEMLIYFTKGQSTFEMQLVKPFRSFFTTNNNIAQQICEGFLIRVYKSTNVLEIHQIDNRGTHQWGQADKTLLLPELKDFKFTWFLPVMSPSCKTMLLQFSKNGRSECADFDTFHRLVLVDLEMEKCFEYCKKQGFFMNLWGPELLGPIEADHSFIDDGQMLEETLTKVQIYKIKRDKGCFYFDSPAQIKLDGKGREHSIFALTRKEVYAYSVEKKAFMSYRFGSEGWLTSAKFVERCEFVLPKAALHIKNIQYHAVLLPPEQENMEPKNVLLMIGLPDVMYLHKLNLSDGGREMVSMEEAANVEAKPIPIRKSKAIDILTDTQIIVQTNHEIVVYDWKLNQKLLRIRLKKKIYSHVTCRNGWIQLQLGKSSLFQVGQNRTPSSEVQTFNDLRHKLLATYSEEKGYLSIDEGLCRWSENGYYAVELYKKDVLISGENRFVENAFAGFNYRVFYSIWEDIICEGIKNRTFEITSDQLDRIFSPIITHGNSNLIYELVKCDKEVLIDIFTDVQSRDRFFSKKRGPIFLDFQGQSAIDIAMKHRDFSKFNILLDQLLAYQNYPETSVLVDSWLVQAIEKGLPLNKLLSSKILSQKIQPNSCFTNFQDFPCEHTDSRTRIVSYPDRYAKLLNDRQAYNQLFGQMFGVQHIDVKYGQEFQLSLSKKRLTSIVSSANQTERMVRMYPITYTVDRIFSCNKEEDDRMISLLKALTNCEEMSYFSHGYIQRFLQYHWETRTKKQYYITFAFKLAAYLLILTNTSLLNYTATYELQLKSSNVRIGLDWVATFLILVATTYPQVQLLLHGKAVWLKTGPNINEIIFQLLFMVTFVLDYLRLTRLKSFPPQDEEALKALNSGDITTSFRIINAALVLSGGWQLLNYALVFKQQSFIIKMITKVTYELLPFIMLFAGALILFGFVFACLDLEFGEDYERMIMKAEILPMFFWVIRTSMGDFDIETFQSKPLGLLIAMFIAWVMCVIFNMLIFLNFLIAVVGDVYGQIMQTREEEQFQKMAQVILQLNFQFETFPSMKLLTAQTIVTRELSKVQTHEDSHGGFLHNVRHTLETNHARFHSLQKQVEQQNTEIANLMAQHANQRKENERKAKVQTDEIIDHLHELKANYREDLPEDDDFDQNRKQLTHRNQEVLQTTNKKGPFVLVYDASEQK